jgi:hypothetical protein
MRPAWLAAIGAGSLFWVLAAGGVAAAITPDEVSKKLAQQFGVRVLRVLPIEVDGKPAFAVRVMIPPGNSNEALRIDTLAVDADTGALLPAFRHGRTGYTLPGDPVPDPNRNVNVPADGRPWR